MPGRNISRTRTTRRKPASSTTQSKAKSTPEPEQPPTDNSSKIVPMSVSGNDSDSSKEMPKSLDLKPVPTYHLPDRPTEVSHLSFSETVTEMGESRPVTASHLHISETLMASGSRPIAASNLQFSETSVISRPIASNDDTDEPDNLMGFLD